MPSKEDKRSNIDPMRIAWLLRADLRRGDAAGGPMSDWFRIWWLIIGPREYPAWAGHDALSKAGLFQPLPQWPMYGGFGMTPALRFLLDARADLASAFDVNTSEGLWEAIAWFYVHGVHEHRLGPALDEKTLAALDATPPFFANKNGASSETPEITWLMFFVWKTSSDLKKHYDLMRTQDRQGYVTWFLMYGVHQLHLVPLLASRWKEWLREPVLKDQSAQGVPRAVHLLWQQHGQLQQAFDLKTESNIKALSAWGAEVWTTQAELSWIDQADGPIARQEPATVERPFGLNLIGFAFGELGIGEDVRMAVAACEAAGIPFSVVNIHPGDNLRQADQALAKHVAHAETQDDQFPFAFNLFCLTAFDTARIYLERGKGLFENRFNIGWWPWELPVWPQDWKNVFGLVDEVWAATTFTHRMYWDATPHAGQLPPTIFPMPMPATVDRVQEVKREQFDLPSNSYLFLYVFDFNSHLARKNPLAAVKAFRTAFNESDDTVRLVLKTMNTNPENPNWKHFKHECDADKRIIILDQTMERGEVLGLISVCDAYISLHRSEGLGRTLAEAMLFGKPVIATNFSGNVDFLTPLTGYPVDWTPLQVKDGEYPYVTKEDGAWWADADIGSAAQKMVAAKLNQSNVGFSQSIQDTARAVFSPSNCGNRIRERLSDIRESMRIN